MALIASLFAAGPAGAQGPARPPAVRSEVAALRLVALQRLPNATGAARAEYCRHLFATPRSEAARRVAAAGWGVTREAAIGPYMAVSFVGSAEAGTSGSCRLGEGNVGLFRGADLVAIAYAPAAGSAAIGSIRPVGPDALRIWDGDVLSQPVADLRLGADGTVAIVPVAAEDRACAGAAVVPNIYGRPIDQARATLFRHGWKPEPPAGPRNDADTRVADLVRHGVPEVEDCSGTGFGFCGFNYRGAAASLSVTTAGDGPMPTVAGYDVTCR
ncbi:hypothetical protein AAFN86_14390 [Roseomonas sp. CAU 1739]|uniref:hypothetical protein n=1 Tax=Roseomonas sp. CAU 1739 TaxID=3140364 RepID=UPI00325BADC4